MSDKFDPYREALVMETRTIWPEEYADWDPQKKRGVEQQLHAQPEKVAALTYIRTHTGFCREITVTDAELARLAKG
jgi:hypothetical protein